MTGHRNAHHRRLPLVLAVSLSAGLFLLSGPAVAAPLPVSSSAPKVGEPAPDFTLPDGRSVPLTLSQLRKETPAPWVLLVFYRGYW